jgi:DNA-binding SARP family transcriptional activator
VAPIYRLRTLGGLGLDLNGAPVVGAAPQRKVLALLAVLAASGEAGIARERLTVLLWPESDEERARGSLKQALHTIRRQLDAPDIVVGAAELRLDAEHIESDVGLFRAALREGELEGAVDAYAGPFLDGVHIEGASELERWVEGERADLARCYAEALEGLARTADARHEHQQAVSCWRRLQQVDPLNARNAVGLMKALEAAGDRAGALQHARIHEAQLRDELGAEPDPVVTELAARMRGQPQSITGDWIAPVVARPPPAPGDPAVVAVAPVVSDLSRTRGTPSGRMLLIIAAAVIGVSLVIAIPSFRGSHALAGAEGVLAIGAIQDFTGDTTGVARVIGDMVATGLASHRDVRVIGSARMYELLTQLVPARAPNAASPAEFERAARAAGAAESVEGSLFRQPGGLLRLDLRRIDLRSGTVRTVQTVIAAEPFALADSAVARFADSPGKDRGIADMTTRSLAAYRLYEEGLRDLTAGDVVEAAKLFRASVREDSTFARAVFYSALTLEKGVYSPAAESLYAHALALSANASERDRLYITAMVQRSLENPAFRVSAESLAARYGDEPEAHLLLGSARYKAGDFLAAIPEFERAIVMDSLGIQGKRPDCTGCQAYQLLGAAYSAADSGQAALRSAREWLRRRGEAGVWSTVAIDLSSLGRFDEALSVAARADSLFPDTDFRLQLTTPVLIQARRFAEADSLLRLARLDSRPARRFEAGWYLTISMRHQGRVREAVELAGSLTRDPPPDGNLDISRIAYAQALFDDGRFVESARVASGFARGAQQAVMPPGWRSRNIAWQLTHAAGAYAAARDTVTLARLADSVRDVGARSGYGRDHLLYHHLRGLLWDARGQRDSAIVEFRKAIWSPTAGYTRSNLELGRRLVAAGRSEEAIATLAPAIRGGIEASNFYVSPIELHELLAQAYAALSARDSAAAHYRIVAEAWRNGDPEFRTRAHSAGAALAALASSK